MRNWLLDPQHQLKTWCKFLETSWILDCHILFLSEGNSRAITKAIS